MHGVSIGRLLECADAAVSIRAPKRLELVRITAMKRWAEGQYSSASMTVRTRVVTFSSAGLGEP